MRVKESYTRERLLGLVGELVEYGELDYLVNKIAKQQGVIEQGVWDVVGAIVIPLLLVMFGLLYGVVRCIKWVCCAKRKSKEE